MLKSSNFLSPLHRLPTPSPSANNHHQIVDLKKNDKKVGVMNELQLLKERINEAGISDTVHKFTSLLKTSKELERQVYDFQFDYERERSEFPSEITELEQKLSNGTDDKNSYDYIDNLCCYLSRKLKFAIVELASKRREAVSLKRHLDDLPIQEEVVQYEHRFSELNAHIQDRLHQTRRYYATYNALLEIKDLMLKEISLLNSLDSQFQDAIKNSAGHMKLIHSMETILKGTRQKLEKVRPGLQVEQKAFDALREQYSAAIANQRHCSTLLKAVQVERRKNEKLKEECGKSKQFDLECMQ